MATYWQRHSAGINTTTYIFNEDESRYAVEDDLSYNTFLNEATEEEISEGEGMTQLSTQDGETYFSDMTDWINAIPGSRPPRKPPA